MDFVLDTRSAKEVISSIFDTAPPKTTSNYKPGIKIIADGTGHVGFYFADSGISVCNTIACEVRAAGSVQVELVPLFRTISAFTVLKDRVGTSSIRFLGKDLTLSIKAVTSYKDRKVRQNRTLQNYDVTMPEVKSLKRVLVELDLNTFSEAMKRIIVSAPNSSDIGGSAGVYFSVSGKEFKLVGTDGPTLTEFIGPTATVVEEDSSCVLPSYFISKLSKLLAKYVREEEDDIVSISLNKRMFVVRFDTIVITSSVVNEPFPEYEEIFVEPKKKLVLRSDIFLDNIRNIVHSSDAEDNFRILIKSLGDELSLSTNSCINDGIPVIEGSSFSVEFNATILENCVRNLVCEEFCMLYAGSGGLVTVVPNTGDLKIRTAIASLR